MPNFVLHLTYVAGTKNRQKGGGHSLFLCSSNIGCWACAEIESSLGAGNLMGVHYNYMLNMLESPCEA